jgi:hypothetical protein
VFFLSCIIAVVVLGSASQNSCSSFLSSCCGERPKRAASCRHESERKMRCLLLILQFYSSLNFTLIFSIRSSTSVHFQDRFGVAVLGVLDPTGSPFAGCALVRTSTRVSTKSKTLTRVVLVNTSIRTTMGTCR